MDDDKRLNLISDELGKVEEFISAELEQRQTSGLPKSDPYIKAVMRALASIQKVRNLL